jgi:hypothetical protein
VWGEEQAAARRLQLLGCAFAFPGFDVGEEPVPSASRAAELQWFRKTVPAHVTLHPHIGHAEALADLTDGQKAPVIGNADTMFDSRQCTHGHTLN